MTPLRNRIRKRRYVHLHSIKRIRVIREGYDRGLRSADLAEVLNITPTRVRRIAAFFGLASPRARQAQFRIVCATSDAEKVRALAEKLGAPPEMIAGELLAAALCGGQSAAVRRIKKNVSRKQARRARQARRAEEREA